MIRFRCAGYFRLQIPSPAVNWKPTILSKNKKIYHFVNCLRNLFFSKCFHLSCGDTAVLHWMGKNTILLALLSAFVHWTFWITLWSVLNSQRQPQYVRVHRTKCQKCFLQMLTESFHPFWSCFMANVAHGNSHQEPFTVIWTVVTDATSLTVSVIDPEPFAWAGRLLVSHVGQCSEWHKVR